MVINNTEQVRFTVRMEAQLYGKLKEAATRNKRSIAKELEYAAEQYLNKTK